MGTSITLWGSMPSSAMGSEVAYSAFFRLAAVNESPSHTITPSFFRYFRLVLSAAGFMATSTSASSPGVNTSLPTLT